MKGGKNREHPKLNDYSGGLYTKAAVTELEPKYSPDCLNVYPEGKILSKRKGIAKLNSATASGNGNGIYNYVKTQTEQVLVALFGNVLKKMTISGSSWGGTWATLSADSANGTNLPDNTVSFLNYQDTLIMISESQAIPQRMTVTDSSHFDIDYSGTGDAPRPKYGNVWNNHLWLLNIAGGGSLLSEGFTTVGAWTSTTTGTISTTTTYGLQNARLYSAATASDNAEIYTDITNGVPDDFEVEMKTYFDKMSPVADGDYATMDVQNGVINLQTRWSSDGLEIYDGAAWVEVSEDVSSEDSWITWRFVATGGTAGTATVDVYKDNAVSELKMDCSSADATSDGRVTLKALAGASSSRADIYFDYIYVEQASARGEYIQNGGMETWTSGTNIAPTNFTVTSGTTIQATTNYRDTYSAFTVVNGTNTATLTQTIASSTVIAGKACHLGAAINAEAGAVYKLRVDDDTSTYDSAEYIGDGGWDYRTLNFTTVSGASAIKAQVIMTVGTVSAGGTATADYYFDSYDSGGEEFTTTPANMVDGSTSNRAWTTTDNQVELLLTNTCAGTSLGDITKVELRYYGYAPTGGNTVLRPVFSGASDGDDHALATPVFSTWDWSAYVDITSDTNAPGSWTWADVVALDCDVENDQPGATSCTVFKVDIRVTYSQGEVDVYVDKMSVTEAASGITADTNSDRIQRTATNTYNDFSGTGSGTDNIRTSGDIGLTGSFKLGSRLYVTKKWSVHKLTYTGSTPLIDIVQVKDTVGTASIRTAKNVDIPGQGEVVIFLGTDRRLYKFDGYESNAFSDNISISNGLSSVYMANINTQALDKAFAINHQELGWYEVVVPIGSSSKPDYSIIYDYINDSFWPFDNRNFSSGDVCDNGAGERVVYVQGNSDGFAYLTNSTNSDSGTAINAYWTSPKMGSAVILEAFDELDITTASVACTPIISWRADWETDWVTETLVASTNSHNYNPGRIDNLFQIKFGDNSSDPAFKLWAVELMTKAIGGGK